MSTLAENEDPKMESNVETSPWRACVATAITLAWILRSQEQVPPAQRTHERPGAEKVKN